LHPSGTDPNNLHVETANGIHAVDLRDYGESATFSWGDRQSTIQLGVRLDTVHTPNVSYDDSAEEAVGTLAGAAIGAILGSIFGQ
jgi:hypothetical protein